jgi:predicted ArsR family transcriptional regulator
MGLHISTVGASLTLGNGNPLLSSALEGPHRTEVLILLLRKGPLAKAEVTKELKLNPTVFLRSVLPPLQDAGLIQSKKEYRGIRRSETHLLSLTIFGKKTAEKLQEIDGLIQEAQKHAKLS